MSKTQTNQHERDRTLFYLQHFAQHTVSFNSVVHLALRSYCEALHWTSFGFYIPAKPIILKPKLSLNQQKRESCAVAPFAKWWKIIVTILMLLRTCTRPQQFAGVTPVRARATRSLACVKPRAHKNAQAQQYWQHDIVILGSYMISHQKPVPTQASCELLQECGESAARRAGSRRRPGCTCTHTGTPLGPLEGCGCGVYMYHNTRVKMQQRTCNYLLSDAAHVCANINHKQVKKIFLGNFEIWKTNLRSK